MLKPGITPAPQIHVFFRFSEYTYIRQGSTPRQIALSRNSEQVVYVHDMTWRISLNDSPLENSRLALSL